MIGVKIGVGYLSYKGVTKWLESIHKDTLEHGTEDNNLFLEQMIDYMKHEYREGKLSGEQKYNRILKWE